MPSLTLEMDVYGKQYTAREDRNTKQYQKKLQMDYKNRPKEKLWVLLDLQNHKQTLCEEAPFTTVFMGDQV